MKLQYQGSVKNFYIEKNPTEKTYGTGIFEFTNDFSIFDYGKMPQVIPNKGEALKRETVYWFNRLEENGIKTHLIEDVDKTKIRVLASRKLKCEEIVSGKTENYVIPVEIIFRNKIPPSSSLHRRLRSGDATPEKYGLRKVPKEGETIIMRRPLIEFSTKLEDTDRYIDEKEALEISGLRKSELKQVKDTAIKVNEIITSEVKRRGLEHIDGKIEMVCGVGREMLVADTVGTSDENRFLFREMDVSKQMVRNYYMRNGWYETLVGARKKGMKDPKPPPMDKEFYRLVNEAYKALCVTITGEPWRDGRCMSIEDVVERGQAILDGMGKRYGSRLKS
jgi:phosphoribosylaminoimidazole-succinocarboxamide synthase